jgi:hypothetical protein
LSVFWGLCVISGQFLNVGLVVREPVTMISSEIFTGIQQGRAVPGVASIKKARPLFLAVFLGVFAALREICS